MSEETNVGRVRSIDILRGGAMVLMALDHVRVYFSNATYSPTDLAQTTTALFLTRWVTHFVAPAFVFLAGTAAYLHGRQLGDRATLSRFLWTRGLWLVLMEMTVIRLGWTFNFDYAHYLLGGVIWMIGWCMVLLAGLVWLPRGLIAVLGGLIVVGHNLVGILTRGGESVQRSAGLGLWQVLYFGGPIHLGSDGPTLFVLFSIIPWVGVMALGYVFGTVFERSPADRRRLCLQIGSVALLGFVVLRGLNLYGDPRAWSPQASATFSVLSFLNTSKYPASLLFLLMTLGPTIACVPVLEGRATRITMILETFGRVPFFFYLLHVPLIHVVALFFALARYGEVIPLMTQNYPIMTQPPTGYGYGVTMIWCVTAAVVTVLFFGCRWFANLKRSRKAWWLSYL